MRGLRTLLSCAATTLMLAAAPVLAAGEHDHAAAPSIAPAQAQAPGTDGAGRSAPPGGMMGMMGKGGMSGMSGGMCGKGGKDDGMGGGGCGMMGKHGGGSGGGGMGMPGRDLSTYVEGRIAFLKAELQITDAQTAPWNAFADALRTIAKSKTKAAPPPPAAEGAPPPSLADRLASHQAALTARLDSLRTFAQAYTALAQTMNDQQKAAAETLIGPYLHNL